MVQTLELHKVSALCTTHRPLTSHLGRFHKAVKGTLQNWFAGSVSTLCNPPYTQTDKPVEVEIDRPSGSPENSEQLITHFALHRCQNKMKKNLTER